MSYAWIISAVFSVFKDSSSYTLRGMDIKQETISKLKFIGQLTKGDKINTRNGRLYIQPVSLGTSLSRTFYNQDNRENGVSFCQDTITNSFELISMYERSNDPADQSMIQNLISDLNKARTGLANLKHTYVADTMVGCKIDTLLESIEVKLGKYSRISDPDEASTTTTSTRTPTSSPAFAPSSIGTNPSIQLLA
jgi:hypothetical protein